MVSRGSRAFGLRERGGRGRASSRQMGGESKSQCSPHVRRYMHGRHYPKLPSVTRFGLRSEKTMDVDSLEDRVKLAPVTSSRHLPITARSLPCSYHHLRLRTRNERHLLLEPLDAPECQELSDCQPPYSRLGCWTESSSGTRSRSARDPLDADFSQ